MGLVDLQEGRIRTPIDPTKTFLDDPLRMLRVFRFAARFGYRVDEEVMKSLKNEMILDSFITKISKERVGNEFRSSWTRPRSLTFLELLDQANFLKIVFWTRDLGEMVLQDELNKGLKIAQDMERLMLEESSINFVRKNM